MFHVLAPGLVILGRPVVGLWVWLTRVGALFGEAVFWLSAGWFQPNHVRFGAVLRHLSDAGIGSLPLTVLFGITIGIVMGIQLASLLELADVLGPFLEAFVSVLMAQIAPLLMGILVATRSGTALVAALARMQLRQEVDALVGMGVEPPRYLVAPVYAGLLIAVPLLNLILVVVILATLSVVAGADSGFTWQLVLTNSIDLVTVSDTALCLFKGVLFATIVAIVSSAYGLGLVGMPRDVGRTMTRSTVVTVGLILVANAVVTIIGN
jgi:phospholipid/cholesterol/gamma-HCH transport system permease protein